MNKNVVIVLIGGFVIAVLVAILVQASLGGASEEAPAKAEVLVAAKDIPAGTTLAPGDLKWQAWPGDTFEGAVVRQDGQAADAAVTGKTIEKVSAGQPFLSSYVFKDGKGNIVAAMLGKGMRAVAIKVAEDTMAGGFVAPGDRVDVIMTYKVEIDGDDENPESKDFVKEQASETVLEKVKVLAVDQESSREDDAAKIGRTATLEVTAKGAERLALAGQMGELTLALRGIGDDEGGDNANGTATTDIMVSHTLENVARIRREQAAARPVRIYNGATVQAVNPQNKVRDESDARFQEERGESGAGAAAGGAQ